MGGGVAIGGGIIGFKPVPVWIGIGTTALFLVMLITNTVRIAMIAILMITPIVMTAMTQSSNLVLSGTGDPEVTFEMVTSPNEANRELFPKV